MSDSDSADDAGSSTLGGAPAFLEGPASAGPVLRATEDGRALLEAIVETNPGVQVLDRGAYFRVAGPRGCALTREAAERRLRADFRWPADLEAVMPSFSGRLAMRSDRVEWEVAEAGHERTEGSSES